MSLDATEDNVVARCPGESRWGGCLPTLAGSGPRGGGHACGAEGGVWRVPSGNSRSPTACLTFMVVSDYDFARE